MGISIVDSKRHIHIFNSILILFLFLPLFIIKHLLNKPHRRIQIRSLARQEMSPWMEHHIPILFRIPGTRLDERTTPRLLHHSIHRAQHM